MKQETKAKFALILSMSIFGTIGIFRRYIPLSSSAIAFVRGVIGTFSLLLVILFLKKPIDKDRIKKYLLLLILSGAMIGFNWILLFEAYNYTSIATATLCYYMAPVIVILSSPFVLKEKLTVKKSICTLVAFVGMVLVSGVIENGFNVTSEMKGVLFGLGAAILYGSVVLINKMITGIDAYSKTIIQLASASITLFPYLLITEGGIHIPNDFFILSMIVMVGVIHTGFAYALYFGTAKDLDAQTMALYSYIDPIVAIILSVLLLHEGMNAFELIGAILILGATIISDLNLKKAK